MLWHPAVLALYWIMSLVRCQVSILLFTIKLISNIYFQSPNLGWNLEKLNTGSLICHKMYISSRSPETITPRYMDDKCVFLVLLVQKTHFLIYIPKFWCSNYCLITNFLLHLIHFFLFHHTFPKLPFNSL